MKFDGKQLDNWAFYLGRLDSITLAVICCGFIEMSTKLDSKMIEFSQSTQLLGKPLQHNNNTNIFHQIRFEDIENNKRMPRN